jgi:2-hydroxychromene-2-carboxylate isomerase
MAFRDKLRAHAINAYLSNWSVRHSRRLRRLQRRGPRVVTFLHQVDDPHSHLLAQCLRTLARGFQVELHIVVVSPLGPTLNPEPDRRHRWALQDARLLATRYGLEFPQTPKRPSVETLALGQRIAAVSHAPERRLEILQRIGNALFQDATNDLKRLASEVGCADPDATAQGAQESTRILKRLGHYHGGVLHFEGENYWGLDRLPFLEERLRSEGIMAPSCVPPARPLADLLSNHVAPDTPLEFFFSFRSPYSYLAIQQTLDLAARTGVPLKIRPVLPMVMRGLPVPKVKRMYIVKDAARLARALNIPFGRICDPVGPGVERCLALSGHAEAQGRLGEFIASATRGIWSEALNVARDQDLAFITTRAGLDWDEARPHLHDPSWRDKAAANRQALLDMGLWGVPSFRYGDQVTWGQDRLFWVEAALSGG